MRTRLIVAHVLHRSNPVAQCSARILCPAVGDGKAWMFTASASPPVALRNALRFIGGGAAMVLSDKVGKNFSYQLTGNSVGLELSVLKHHGGKQPIRRNLYYEVYPAGARTTVTLRVGTGSVLLAEGPMRELTSGEALALFGNHYVQSKHYKEGDGIEMGLRIEAEPSMETMRHVATIDESGNETRVAVRRRRRMID